MQLWLVVQPVGEEPSDLAVEVAPECPAQDLVNALARQVGADSGRAAAYCQRLQRWLEGDETVSSLGLQTGDRLVVSQEGPLPTRESTTSAEDVPFRLALVGGPMSGLRVGLATGEHLLGRTPGCTVQIDDPSLSGEHIRIRVSSDGVRIADAGSSNGTFLEGEAVVEERAVEPGQLVRAGRSLVTFERREPREPMPLSQDGSILFNRPPHVRPRVTPKTIEAPDPPDEGHRLRPPMAAAIVPLFGGIALWLFTRSPISLVFAALAPVMALWTFLEDRRRGRKSFGKQTGEFHRKLGELAETLKTGRAEEIQARRQVAPDAAELLERARRYPPGLWERRPEDDDFLFAASWDGRSPLPDRGNRLESRQRRAARRDREPD